MSNFDNEHNKPNIFEYDDYRKFLSDTIDYSKKKNARKYSYRNISRLAGFQAPNYFSQILSGKRNLSRDSIRKVAHFIDLAGKKLDYFKYLVLLNQSVDQLERASYYKTLVSFKEYREAKLLKADQSLYLTKWYYATIREMVKMSDFCANPKWISEHITPKISPNKAEEAWEVLLKLKLVKKNPDGSWVQAEPSVTTSREISNDEIVNYHENMIRLGYNSIGFPLEKREIRGMTFSTSPAKRELIRKKLDQFQEDVQKILFQNTESEDESLTDVTSEVYQFNMQLFPLALQENDE